MQADMDSAVDACAVAEQRAAAAEAALTAHGIAIPTADGPAEEGGEATPHANEIALTAARDVARNEAAIAQVGSASSEPILMRVSHASTDLARQASLGEAVAQQQQLRAVAGRCAATAARYRVLLEAEQRRSEELSAVTRAYMQEAKVRKARGSVLGASQALLPHFCCRLRAGFWCHLWGSAV
jgi:hypothetical protein